MKQSINLQEMCRYFYDYGIMPRFEEEWDNRRECAEALKTFLDRMGLSFKQFYELILNYSLGNGLQYMREVNEMIPLLSPIFDRNDIEMDLSFHENSDPGAGFRGDPLLPAPNTIPHGGENDGNIHQ